MKKLAGFTEDYREYVDKESKLYVNMRKSKRMNILYAEELKKSIIPNTILFYGSNGYGLGGIPKALLSKVAKNPDFSKYKFIICLRSKEMIRQMKAEGYRSLKFHYVELGTSLPKAFYQYMARAQYLVVDGVLPSVYIPREEQTYVQASFLYSGMNQGYKREMRYTVRSMEYIKNMLAADYVISSSELYTKEILQDSYCLGSSYQGKILTCKSPVIEKLNQMTTEQACRETIREQGEKKKKEILVIGSEARGGIEIAKIIRKVSNAEEYKDCIFYIKPPQVGYRDTREWMEKKPSDNVKLLLNQTDILRWIKRCDIVVSDYGADLFYSIYSGKPTVLLDVAERGALQCTYMKEHLAALPMASTGKELIKVLREVTPLGTQCIEELFSASLSADRILDVLLGKDIELPPSADSAERVCVFASMGHYNTDVLVAWEAQLSKLLEQMIQEGKDVTVFSDEPSSEFYLEKIEKMISKKARVIYRESERIMTKPEMIDSSYLIRNFIFCEDMKEALGMLDIDLNRRDLKRSMGNLSFDTAIYAGPFSAKYVLLFAALEAKKKYYWDQRNYSNALNTKDRTEKNELRFRNLCRLPELFEGVLHWDEAEMDVLKREDLIVDEDKHQLIKNGFPFEKTSADEKYAEPDTVLLRGQEYWIVSEKEYLDGQRDMQLIAKYADREHRKALFITSASKKRLEDILILIGKLHEKNPEDVFYIFEGQKTCYNELKLLLANMEMQDYVVLCSKYLPWDILRMFSVYYCTFETNDIYENLCRQYDVAYEKLL